MNPWSVLFAGILILYSLGGSAGAEILCLGHPVHDFIRRSKFQTYVRVGVDSTVCSNSNSVCIESNADSAKIDEVIKKWEDDVKSQYLATLSELNGQTQAVAQIPKCIFTKKEDLTTETKQRSLLIDEKETEISVARVIHVEINLSSVAFPKICGNEDYLQKLSKNLNCERGNLE